MTDFLITASPLAITVDVASDYNPAARATYFYNNVTMDELPAGTWEIELAVDGGVQVGGTAPLSISATLAVAGGVEVGGTTELGYAPGNVIYVSGGVQVSGEATIIDPVIRPSGGVSVGGTTPLADGGSVLLPSGGATVTGAAVITFSFLPRLEGVLPSGMTAEMTRAIDGMMAGDIPIAFESVMTGGLDPTGALAASFKRLTGTFVGNFEQLKASFQPLDGALTGKLGAVGTLTVDLPAPLAVDLLGRYTTVGNLSVALPSPALFTGTGLQGISGVDTDMDLPGPMAGVFAGQLGVAAALIGTLPLPTLSTSGFQTILGTLNGALTLLTFAGSPLAAAGTGTLWTMNLKTGAVTEYRGVSINSVAVFGGVLLAAGPDGLFAMTGSADEVTVPAAPVDCWVTTGVADFKSDYLKRSCEVWAGYSSPGAARLYVVADNTSYRYDMPATQGRPRTHKTHIGKGIRHRYFKYKFTNANGADLVLDNIHVTSYQQARRV